MAAIRRGLATFVASIWFVLAVTSVVNADLEYVERLTGGADVADTLPMLVGIHGLGDRPESFALLFDTLPIPARIILPRAPNAHGDGFSWFHFTPHADEAAMAEGVAAAADAVLELVGRLQRELPTRGKPVLTGFSQGGMLTFALAARAPTSAALFVPLAGFLPYSLRPPPKQEVGGGATMGATGVRVIAFHGAADPVIRITAARQSVQALVAAGYVAELRDYAAQGHTLSPTMRGELSRVLAVGLESRVAAGSIAPASEAGATGDEAQGP